MEAGPISDHPEFEAFGGDVAQHAVSLISLVRRWAMEAVREQMPDLEGVFPVARHFAVEHHLDPSGWLAIRGTFEANLSLIVIKMLKAEDVAVLRRLVETAGLGPDCSQIAALGPEWVAYNRFTYVGPFLSRCLFETHIEDQIEWWLNTVVVPEILERNRQRVLRAVPLPPSYDVNRIRRALWVLECEETCRQGSAFEFGQRGLATCAHSIGPATVAFRASEPMKRHPVEVIAKHDVLDLALLRFPEPSVGLDGGDSNALRQMDHLLVAGHPNHRLGDTVMVVPGLVVGFRPRSGIRRILTNAAIVAGCSGGPVIGPDGRVVGVAVTGTDSFAQADKTEDHGIIPVDAFDLLGSGS